MASPSVTTASVAAASTAALASGGAGLACPGSLITASPAESWHTRTLATRRSPRSCDTFIRVGSDATSRGASSVLPVLSMTAASVFVLVRHGRKRVSGFGERGARVVSRCAATKVAEVSPLQSSNAVQVALDEALGEFRSSPKATQGSLRPLVVAMGTRGDVEPCLHLAKALTERGHCPLVVSLDQYKSQVVDTWGFKFHTCGLESIPMNENYFAGQTRADQVYADRGWYGDAWVSVGRNLYAAASEHQCDVIVSTTMGNTHALDVAEKLGLLCVTLKFCPDIDGQVPTGSFPPTGYPSGMPPPLNYAAHVLERLRILVSVFVGGFIPRVNEFRADIGLPAMQITEDVEVPTYSPYRQTLEANQPSIYAFSQALADRPVEYKPWHFVTGVLGRSNGDASGPPKCDEFEPSLEGFLTEAEATSFGGVACIAFGSMTLARMEGFQERAVSAARRLGFHVLVVDPDAEEEGLDHKSGGAAPVYRIRAAPYTKLFPRCCIVVHHGGAGTMQDCLWACVPQVVAPILRWSDQPFWAERMQERGFGVQLGQGGQTPDDSAWEDALQRCVEQRASMRSTARAALECSASERGAEEACEVLEALTAPKF